MPPLTEAIERRLRGRGAVPLLLWNDEVFSFADLDEWSAQLAAGLVQRGIRAGDRIALGLPNSPALVAMVLAVLRSGAVLVPLNPSYTAGEAAHLITDSGATLVITHAEQGGALRHAAIDAAVLTDPDALRQPQTALPARPPEGPALIMYTSGTTGLPKGAMLSERALLSNLTTVARAWQWTEADRLLLTLPCFHLHGLALGLLGSLLAGSSIVLRPRFIADEVPDLLGRHRCTMFFGVPTMYHRLATLADAGGAGLPRLRLWVSGSAPLGRATFERFRQRFGQEILERFGMTEGGFMITTPFEGPRRPGVVGRPLPGIDVQIVDADEADRGRLVPVADGVPGELLIRGPNLFSGYWRRPEETRRAFVGAFFRSGDLALKEPDGMIRIVGRRSVDIIKSRGFKISAVEIEDCLQAHSAVADVAVVGVPDPERGEAVVAVVCAVPGASVSPQELRAFVGQHLAPHKVPARVVFLDELPRSGPGKANKRELIARLGGTL